MKTVIYHIRIEVIRSDTLGISNEAIDSLRGPVFTQLLLDALQSALDQKVLPH
jgi:hypothetical protein